ncbi:membrane protein [marine actinobacterium PHSC20C1]|nr:membrane protein [marine actinobacterium PHSC20C1]
MKSSAILGRAIAYGAILTVAIAVVGSIIGFLVAGSPGLISALIGAGLTALFMGFTAGSIVLASRATHGDPSSTLFFGIVLGAWLLKFVVFIAILVILRGQPFLEPLVFFFAILAAVIGSLVVDVLAFVRARESYVPGVSLPGEDTSTSN